MPPGQKAKLPHAVKLGPGQRDPIAEFNAEHPLEEVLERNGYIPCGSRYLRPGSESGIPGLVIFRDGGREACFSHGGDKLSDGKAHDAFDVFRILECSGDWATALNWNPDITADNRQNYGEQKHQALPVAGTAVFTPPALVGTDARDGTANTRPLTELGNADRIVDAYADIIRYVCGADLWLYWMDGAWTWDSDGAKVRGLAASLPNSIYAEGHGYLNDAEFFAKWARKSQDERTIKAAVSLLKDKEMIRVPLGLVDAAPFLVGLDGCRQVIDLKTGKTRPARQEDYITKTLSADSLGDPAKAVRWVEFLGQVFDGDLELVGWLKRWCGYLLTGSTNEQILLFFFGFGANGKSVLAETLRHVMGDYARAVAAETLTESRRQAGSATPDLAALIGARLAVSSETEDGAALAESLIKTLVSGDTLSVRQLYAGPVQFSPQFKLVVLGNHKPVIRGQDHGIWRRVRLVPFGKTFNGDERDLGLLDKLRAETPHILAWMVEGCLEWQWHGLADVPTAIRQATAEYKEEQDLIGRWLDECCRLSPGSETPATELYRNYQAWACANGLKPASAISLGRRLGERAFTSRKSNGKRLWVGLVLLSHGPAGFTSAPDSVEF